MHTTRELLLKIETDIFPVAEYQQVLSLSPRGKVVLELFMRSFSYQQIAEHMGISVSGVRRHCEKMLWKKWL